jgi:hypothetical protein
LIGFINLPVAAFSGKAINARIQPDGGANKVAKNGKKLTCVHLEQVIWLIKLCDYNPVVN